MRMIKLQVEMETYGKNKGKYEGRVFFENNFKASIQIPLNDTISRRVLDICADELVQASKSAAEIITAQVIEATNNASALKIDQP